MKLPLLSVCLITYNHKDFISQAIESVLMQKVNFPYELIIADDFSTDGTRDILNEYKAKYPDLIKLILQEKNIGPAKNWMDLITSPNEKVKYIAYFEGDDYWTDPLKLQKQVDFLEANPSYSICFHKVKILQNNLIKEDKSIELRYENIKEYPATITDLLEQGNFMHTASVLFRNYNINFPFEFKFSSVGDYFLHIINAQRGPIKRLDDVMAVYRVGLGIFSSLSSIDMLKKIIIYQSCLLSYLNEDKHKKIVLEKLLDNLNELNKYHKTIHFIGETFSFNAIIKALILKIKKSF